MWWFWFLSGAHVGLPCLINRRIPFKALKAGTAQISRDSCLTLDQELNCWRKVHS